MDSSHAIAEVLIPIKSFRDAKHRLSPELDPDQRAALARAMATRVIEAAHPFAVNVVCDDEEVSEFATRAGARVIWCPERGLNPAVKEGVETLRDRGVTEVVVSHADLPFATSFSDLTGWPGVTLVPDRHRRGTNVAVVPTSVAFQWAYGSGSLGRHRSETIRLGLPLRIVRSDELAWDIDIPDDLREGPAGVSAATLLPSPS